MKLEEISNANLKELTNLVLKLWVDSTFKEEYENCKRILNSNKETSFLGRMKTDYIGFIYLSLRQDYVEGATSSPIVYIEGLYVEPDFRKTGIGKVLVDAGEQWGKSIGCSQYASDTDLSNQHSINFHKKVGFKEVNQVTCFLKNI